MAILSPNIQTPPGIPRPDFAGMARDAASQRVENQWFHIPEQELTIGYEDPESDDGPDSYFAWDNEREHAAFLVDTGKTETIPVAWVRLDAGRDSETMNNRYSNTESRIHIRAKGSAENEHGEPEGAVSRGHGAGDWTLEAFVAQHGIRTVWGPIPLSQAVDWPATASWNEVTSYGEWKGGGVRIPTLHEVRSIHEYAARLPTTTNPPPLSRSNPTNSKNKHVHTDHGSLFVDLSGADVGLQNFHPVPITHRGDRLCGLGDLGGAWEWTSTVFAPQPGFKPMDIYPGYSGKCTYFQAPSRSEVGF